MKKIVYIVVAVLLVSCNGENVPDCFQNAGDIIEKEFSVDAFSQITVYPRIELIVTDAPTQKVRVQTGEYLMPEIDVRVENGRLKLFNDNACNLTRDYGITKVFVSAPNLTEIRNGSSYTVSSNGVLNYETLKLVSEDFIEDNGVNTNGMFDLEVDCDAIDIVINNLSTIYISGFVETLFVGYYSGDARFEGRDLVAQDVSIFQRSSNDMIINAQQSLTGEIRSTGDVILVNTPLAVNVQQFYTGQLIFE
ncbi:Putative auto-transporter adhesin, head GIN domain [Formosa sp. Hel1_31_208]|uniref:head GIN domain-containing protein n=1 Tax=Formosa sp. Hel1_31_208 TaxID=1798225 RepID=UPI00087C0583|nr:head GIN domain-containing protein [Formosa sp. Hel1_31_208]SDR66399.1 Putative auto-transporter adhesin, head GIN domain [Formosa sp. Hel1_31_208]